MHTNMGVPPSMRTCGCPEEHLRYANFVRKSELERREEQLDRARETLQLVATARHDEEPGVECPVCLALGCLGTSLKQE